MDKCWRQCNAWLLHLSVLLLWHIMTGLVTSDHWPLTCNMHLLFSFWSFLTLQSWLNCEMRYIGICCYYIWTLSERRLITNWSHKPCRTRQWDRCPCPPAPGPPPPASTPWTLGSAGRMQSALRQMPPDRWWRPRAVLSSRCTWGTETWRCPGLHTPGCWGLHAPCACLLQPQPRHDLGHGPQPHGMTSGHGPQPHGMT